MSGPRWKLIHLAAAIAALAASFAAIGVTETALGLAFLLPVAFARPGRRMAVAAWAVTLGPPACLLLTLYVGWALVCYRLGGRPLYISDSYILAMHNTAPLQVVIKLLDVERILGIMAMPVSIVIASVQFARSWKTESTFLVWLAPVLALLAIWFAFCQLLKCGPKEVCDWFGD